MGLPTLPASGSAEFAIGRKPRGAVLEDMLGSSRRPATRSLLMWAMLLLVFVFVKDNKPFLADAAYEHAHGLFLRGDLIRAQAEAERGYQALRNSNHEKAVRFRLLAARALLWRGMYQDALNSLAVLDSTITNRDHRIESLTLAGVANTYLSRWSEANHQLTDAQSLCRPAFLSACSDVQIARGILAVETGKLDEARQIFFEGLAIARQRRDQRMETSSLLNLGVIADRSEHYDDAVDWSTAAYRLAVASNSETRAENILGNLGWDYFKLGDIPKALDLSLDAQQRAEKLGDYRLEIKWLANAGVIYQTLGDSAHAVRVYQQSLDLAKRIQSKADIIISLEDLVQLSIKQAAFDAASSYIEELTPLIQSSGGRRDELEIVLAHGQMAAAQGRDQDAVSFFRSVEHNPACPASMRLSAEHQLARLFEAQGNTTAAESTYQTALTTFATARQDLKNEESKLPFLTNATPIYDDYIHFLVKQGRADEALAAADQSRAQTLAQGLGVETARPSLKPAALRAGLVARKNESTVLYYWLGKQQSYLWAITPKKTALFPLPAERDITQKIERYRKALLQPELGRDRAQADGLALYQTLVAPAAETIQPNGNVVVVCDGALSLLNFETLLVPGPRPHYWIEDANIVSAPSLSMLAARHAPSHNQKLLLLGDAVSPNPDYPRLPMARAEIEKIARHFAPADETVFERQAANSGAYLNSPLRDYAFIHFVAHGVASRTDPLDSAIILSRNGVAEDSFKLHAREIIQHPIAARLVTISACYGGGTRSYAGEGLVGLSWAFLRAGAHNVIGALWEASDDSTPQLMDKMYAGLADGKLPSVALRDAKLALLHSDGKFREPFYWAPFQLYAGL